MAADSNETVEEALGAVCKLVSELYEKEHGERCDVVDVHAVVRQVRDRIEAAWRREKKPKRNCDRFDSCGEASEAYRLECCDYREYKDGKTGETLSARVPTSRTPRFWEWLFARCREGGAG